MWIRVVACVVIDFSCDSCQLASLSEAFEVQAQVISAASQYRKPANLAPLLGPMSAAMERIGSIADGNRPAPVFNHLTFVKEGAMALGWLGVEPKPAPFIQEMRDAAKFYGDRVLKEYKDK